MMHVNEFGPSPSISLQNTPSLQISAVQNDFLDGVWDEQFKRRLYVLHMKNRHPCWPWLHPYHIDSHVGWLITLEIPPFFKKTLLPQ